MSSSVHAAPRINLNQRIYYGILDEMAAEAGITKAGMWHRIKQALRRQERESPFPEDLRTLQILAEKMEQRQTKNATTVTELDAVLRRIDDLASPSKSPQEASRDEKFKIDYDYLQ